MGSNSAVSLFVSSAPDDVNEVDVVTFTYQVYNHGNSKLCSIDINNSPSGAVTLEPFDLESGENTTHTAEYVITSEDRKLPALVNDVSAIGHSCEEGTITAISGSRFCCDPRLERNPIKITSFGEQMVRETPIQSL